MGIEGTAMMIWMICAHHKLEQGKELRYQMQSGGHIFTDPGLPAVAHYWLLVIHMPQGPPETSTG